MEKKLAPTSAPTARVAPLTHCNLHGEVYRRAPAVERQIAEALTLSRDEVRARAALTDPASHGYLQEECLVCLIRHYHVINQAELENALSEILLQRSTKMIIGRLGSLEPEYVNDGYDQVITALFERILDLESDRGDFFQVRFWLGLEKLAIRAFNDQLKQHQRSQAAVSLELMAGYDGDSDGENERTIRPRGGDQIAIPSGEARVEQIDLIRDALSCLKEPTRSAFLLYNYAGIPIEAQDPNVWTISQRFERSPRTIRLWLSQAKERLDQWRGEQL